MTHFGGDYSNHDWTRGDMNIAAMQADGIEGGFHKFTDGLNYYVDPYFQTAANRMRDSSFKYLGCYHVLWGNRDIVGQVDWLIYLLDAQVPWWRSEPRWRVMSDDEPFGYNVKPTPDQINQFHDTFRNRLDCPQFAYAPRWTYGTGVEQIKYPVVASNYGSNPAVHYPAGYPGDGSSRWVDDVLQYGSQLSQGLQQYTDVNAIKDDAIWAQLVGVDMALTLREKADIARLVLLGLTYTEGHPGAVDPAYQEIDGKGVQYMLNNLNITGGGLTDADKALIQQAIDSANSCKASVDALNSRLSTP